MNTNGIATEQVVTSLSEVPPGEGRAFQVNGQQVAIFHSRAGEVFATEALCPHKAGPLADGLVGDGMVLCPLHAWKFDLRTGTAVTGTCDIKTYPARLDEKSRILITL